MHGALPWTMPYERRLALYRFANANYAYGRAYLNEWSGAAAKCTAAQKAVLLPPYAPRLERPMAPATGDAGEVVAFERDPKKKAHVASRTVLERADGLFLERAERLSLSTLCGGP